MINYYFDNTHEMRPYTHKLEANDGTLAPDNALRISPEFKESFHPCEKDGGWYLVEDYRDKIVYNIKTKESVKVDYLGPIRTGFTLLKPFQFSKWDEDKWVLDENEKTAFKIKQNKIFKNSLLNDANQNISMFQDAIDLGMSEKGDDEKLKLWKKYRILLNRIDASDINVIFPEKP